MVVKFGGTSVSTRPRWDAISGIVKAHRDAGKRVLIVVSALSGITDRLKSIGDASADREFGRHAVPEVAELHRRLADDMGLPDHGAIDPWLQRLTDCIERDDTARESFAWQAELLAHGELLSSSLGAAYLSANGLPTRWLDSRRYLQTEALPNQNDWSNWLCASLAVARRPEVANELSALGDVFIAQGFIARQADGQTVVLGRGGSDTSAACFGAMLGAEAIEIWTASRCGFAIPIIRTCPAPRSPRKLRRLRPASRRSVRDAASPWCRWNRSACGSRSASLLTCSRYSDGMAYRST